MRFKASVFALFTLLVAGCGKTIIVHAPGPVMAPGAVPVGFWQNKEATVQVRHIYRELVENKKAATAEWKKRGTLGTGVVFKTDGLIVTNNHVVDVEFEGKFKPLIKDEKFFVCQVPDGILNCKEAKVLVKDPAHDLAFIKVDKQFPKAVEFTDNTTLVAGDEVYGWGNAKHLVPMGPLFGRYIGLIAEPYVDQKISRVALPLLLFDLGTIRGYSGGAIFNMSGKCVGLNSMHTSAEDGRPHGIAIPSNTILKLHKNSESALRSK